MQTPPGGGAVNYILLLVRCIPCLCEVHASIHWNCANVSCQHKIEGSKMPATDSPRGDTDGRALRTPCCGCGAPPIRGPLLKTKCYGDNASYPLLQIEEPRLQLSAHPTIDDRRRGLLVRQHPRVVVVVCVQNTRGGGKGKEWFVQIPAMPVLTWMARRMVRRVIQSKLHLQRSAPNMQCATKHTCERVGLQGGSWSR